MKTFLASANISIMKEVNRLAEKYNIKLLGEVKTSDCYSVNIDHCIIFRRLNHEVEDLTFYYNVYFDELSASYPCVDDQGMKHFDLVPLNFINDVREVILKQSKITLDINKLIR